MMKGHKSDVRFDFMGESKVGLIKQRSFFDSLTPEQQKKALRYRGPENHGDPAFRNILKAARTKVGR